MEPLFINGPLLLLLFSGKRKCGKDYIAEKLLAKLEDKGQIIRISKPIKSHYAEVHNLNLEELLSNSEYKEKYRLEMIRWSDEKRKQDPGYFCEAATKAVEVTPVWIISDIRRKTDIKWFRDHYCAHKCKVIRVTADDSVRQERGWVFTEGIDDVASECDLDDFEEWDLKISNNNEKECEEAIERLQIFIIESLPTSKP